MSKPRVPRANPTTDIRIIPPQLDRNTENIVFSFASLEKNEYFNLDCTCENWSADLIDMMKNISVISKRDLLSGKFRTYRVHPHENAKPPCSLPRGVELKDFYQMRISQSKGGIHGVFSENVFYVMWMDPLHNMYPDDRYGGLRVVHPPTTCCMERDALIDELQKENQSLKEEIELWEMESKSNSNTSEG